LIIVKIKINEKRKNFKANRTPNMARIFSNLQVLRGTELFSIKNALG